jgi:hypothetical protein
MSVRALRTLLFALMSVALLALPASAMAAGSIDITGSSAHSQLNVQEPSGDAVTRRIIVTHTLANEWTVEEGVAAATPTPDGVICQQTTATKVTCDTTGLTVDAVNIIGGDGDDEIELLPGSETASLLASGKLGDDVIYGAAGNDHLYGFAATGDASTDGPALLFGGCGPDDFHGGGSIDVVSYDDRSRCPLHDFITASLDNALNDGQTGPGGSSEGDIVGGSSTSIEGLAGSQDSGGDGDDTLTGDVNGNVLYGYSGIDHLDGGGGPDELWGGADGDTLTGGTGVDLLHGEAGGDTIHAADGEVDSLIDCGGDANNNGDKDSNETLSNCSDPSNSFGTGGGGGGGPTYGTGDLKIASGVLTIAPDNQNHHIVVTKQSATDFLVLETSPSGPALPAPTSGCVAGADSRTVTCSGMVTSIDFTGGTGNDNFDAHAAGVGVLAKGGDGADLLVGSDADDILAGDDGPTDTAGDGNDILVGGSGKDQYFGGGGVDTVSFQSDHDAFRLTHGVSASLDDVANDGAEDENIGGASNSIENLAGTDLGDSLAGNDLTNTISGNGGDDNIVAGGGNDVVFAGEGNDDVNVRDKANDSVACEAGSDDEVVADGLGTDEIGSDCEVVDRGAPAIPVGGGSIGGVVFASVSDTTRNKPFPEIRGMQYGAAESLLNKLALAGTGPYVEWKPATLKYGSVKNGGPLGKNPTGGNWQEGDVLSVRYSDGVKVYTTPGHLVSTGAATPVTVTLTIYGGTTHDSCVQDAKDFAGLPFDDQQAALKALHCKIDDTRVELVKTTTARGEVDLNSGDRCEAGRKIAAAGTGRIDDSIVVPDNAKDTDLRVYVMESPEAASIEADKGTLRVSGDGKAAFEVYVGGRTGAYRDAEGDWVNQFLNGATVYVDATAVGGGTVKKSTGTGGLAPGTMRFLVNANRAGRIRIAATWSDSKGQMICGGGHIDVAGPYPVARVVPDRTHKASPGTIITTQMGRQWEYVGGTGSGWAPVKVAAKAVSGKAVGRSGIGTWFSQLGSWLGSLFNGGKKPAVSSAVGTTQASATNLDATLKAKLAMLNYGTGSSLGSLATLISPNGAAIVAQGGGNIISGNGSAIISNDGASIVAQGGGNMVFGYSPATGIVAQGGGNIISTNGGGIVAQGGGNIVAQGGGNIISTNGGGIVSPNGGTIISTGGGGLIAAAGSNIVAQGGGNIVAQGGGN